MKGRILTISNSDSSGCNGIQGDIKTITALGGYAASAVTTLGAENTRGIHDMADVPVSFVASEIVAVLDDIGADCIKTGMLPRADIVDAVCEVLETRAKGIPLIVDPMITKGRNTVLAKDAVARLRERLVPKATLLTLNTLEAESLTGMEIDSINDAAAIVGMLAKLGPKAVLMTGGELYGDEVTDLYRNEEGKIEVLLSRRIATANTRGTGGALAAAIATGLAQGMTMHAAIARARAYVHKAIATAPGLGHGRSPINHGHTVPAFEEITAKPMPGDPRAAFPSL